MQPHSILNFVLSVLPPVTDHASFSALENTPQAAFIAVCRYETSRQKFLGKNPKVFGNIGLICKTVTKLVFLW